MTPESAARTLLSVSSVAATLQHELGERPTTGPRPRTWLARRLRRMAEGDDRPDERWGGQTEECADMGSFGLKRPADRRTETERACGDEELSA